MTTNKKHNWDKSGERCLNCGDKDWMASAECNGRMTTNKDIEEAVEVCEMVEEIGMPDDTIMFFICCHLSSPAITKTYPIDNK